MQESQRQADSGPGAQHPQNEKGNIFHDMILSSNRLAYTLDSTFLISITDYSGKIAYANDAFCQFSGFSRAELIGKTHSILSSGIHSREFYQQLWQTILAGEIWRGEIKNKSRTGEFFWSQTTISPFPDERGNPRWFLAIHNDITAIKRYEHELVQYRENLTEAQKLAKIGSWEWSPTDDDPVWSPEMFRIFGLSPGAKAANIKQVQEYYEPDSWARLSEAIQCAYENGTPYQIECELKEIDHKKKWVISSGAPVYDDTQKIIGLRGTVQDITSLKISEERNRLIVNAFPDLIFILNSDGTFADYQATDLHKLAYSPEQFLGKTFRDIFETNLAEKMENAFLSAYKKSENQTLEYALTFSGEKTFYTATFTKLSDSRVMAVVRDITTSKNSENKLREMAMLLDVATDAILVRDIQNHIIFWNKGAEKLYGYQEHEALGKDAGKLLYDNEETFILARQIVLEQGSFSGELTQKTKNNQMIIVQARWTLLNDDEGHPRSILAINTDITERKNLERQFLRSQRLESIGTLAGGIAHNLNNALTPVLLAVFALRESGITVVQEPLVNLIESSANRCAEMVKQVLSFARGTPRGKSTIDIRLLIADTEKIIRETFPKSIESRTEVPRDLWCVTGDYTQLHQVLLNIAVNARDAMPDGGKLSVKASNVSLDEQFSGMQGQDISGDYVMISIEDSGTGISPDDIDKIFEPFFTTKNEFKGTGLGLSTSLGIVQSHQGFIRTYSEPGVGTTFHIYLPAEKSAARNFKKSRENLPARGNGELILVTDDEQPVREITQRTLENNGFRVITACDGAEAVAIFAQHKDEISLVIMDIMMPVLDGVSASKILMHMKPNLPIIAVSGINSGGRPSKLAEEGITAFLTKPYTAVQLLGTIQTALGLRKT